MNGKRSRARKWALTAILGSCLVACLLWISPDTATVESTARAVVGGGSLCPEDAFRAKETGGNGGCLARACCETNEIACSETRIPRAFPKLVTAKVGHCWSSPEGDWQDWCEETECGDDLCGVGCTQGDSEIIRKHKPVRGRACPDTMN